MTAVAATHAGRRPGLDTTRVARLMRACVARMRIDLSGAVVLTEAATGPYAVTPVVAAMAGAAEVLAVTRPSRYGSVDDVRAQTLPLAHAAGVTDRLSLTTADPHDLVDRADVVTNSGHVRPLDDRLVAAMKPTAVVSLMFESWEIQAGRFDLDLEAMHTRGIAVAGTNERHPQVDVFSYLPTMAVKLLLDSGTAVRNTNIAVLCDNPFASFLDKGLRAAGATVHTAARIAHLPVGWTPDVVLVALRPRHGPVLSHPDAALVADRWPEAFVAQFWGDLDRDELADLGVRYWPLDPPGVGHMAVLPSDVGPEPVVRLQAAGLKVASVLRTPPAQRTAFDREFVDEL